MSIGSQYFETKDGYTTYHFDKIDSREMCQKIADECRSNAFFERMISIAFVVAALATIYLGLLALAAIASTYGLFTTVVTIIALVAISSIFRRINVVALPLVALGSGFFIYWNSADHYNQQAHLADLRAAKIGQELKKSIHIQT
ncbi:MAG: hypothetical protein KR126chlam3_00418 [Chlamydiae bacterium]|nr:hypothetical protein [Chlamydiota bacterium]